MRNGKLLKAVCHIKCSSSLDHWFIHDKKKESSTAMPMLEKIVRKEPPCLMQCQ